MPESHTFSGRDSKSDKQPDGSSLPNYIYYRIYTENGAIPSMTPVTPSDACLGRIKVISVPPPRTAKAVKRSIAKVEKIKNLESTGLFPTPFSESSMDEVTLFNGTGPGLGSTPLEPLALVANMSDSERSVLESDGRGASGSTVESGITLPEIRYVYYLLYADDDEMPSKVAFDPEKPSLGRIRTDYIAPPHTPTSIRRCISRVERSPAIAYANLFVDSESSSEVPTEEGHISLRTVGPGLSSEQPMAVVLSPPIPGPDGKYVIKNRAEDIYWAVWDEPMKEVHFFPSPMMVAAKAMRYLQWDITHDTNGNISMSSFAPSSWVGANLAGSTVPVSWRLIPANPGSYYLTTDMNHVSRNPRVPAAQKDKEPAKFNVKGTMATLEEGDQWQMWEFIRV